MFTGRNNIYFPLFLCPGATPGSPRSLCCGLEAGTVPCTKNQVVQFYHARLDLPPGQPTEHPVASARSAPPPPADGGSAPASPCSPAALRPALVPAACAGPEGTAPHLLAAPFGLEEPCLPASLPSCLPPPGTAPAAEGWQGEGEFCCKSTEQCSPPSSFPAHDIHLSIQAGTAHRVCL